MPALAHSKETDGEAATHRLIDSVATVLAWALLVTCALGVIGAPVLVWALASGFKQTPHSFEAAVLMTRWMFPYIGFMSMVALSAGRAQHLEALRRAGVHAGAAEPVDDRRGLAGRALVRVAWASSRSTPWPAA